MPVQEGDVDGRAAQFILVYRITIQKRAPTHHSWGWRGRAPRGSGGCGGTWHSRGEPVWQLCEGMSVRAEQPGGGASAPNLNLRRPRYGRVYS